MSTARGDIGDAWKRSGASRQACSPGGAGGRRRGARAWRRATWRRKRAASCARRAFASPPPSPPTVNDAIKGVDDALAAGDLERLRKAIATLDDAMDDHLSFARKSTLREYAESIGVAVAVALLLRAFVVEAFQIPSGSMIPTLEVGDHIFVSKFSYGLSVPFTDIKFLQYGQPERGDVIVFKFPLDKSIDYIKRVVGAPRRHRRGPPGASCTSTASTCRASASPGRVATKTTATAMRRRGRCSGSSTHDDCENWIETLGRKQHEIDHRAAAAAAKSCRAPWSRPGTSS